MLKHSHKMQNKVWVYGFESVAVAIVDMIMRVHATFARLLTCACASMCL